MELILWRHAEAEEGVPDAARELTNKGLKQAQDMAAWLKSEVSGDIRVIVSPSRRTQQTAMAFSREFETTQEVGTSATVDRILTITDWPNAQGTTVVVGHQPTLGEVAISLTPNIPAHLRVRKGSVWWFGYEAEAEGEETVLRTVMYPSML